jgi:hypothetical protein
MPYGLEVHNADGSLGFTTTDRLTRIIAITTIGGSGAQTGSVTSAGFATGTPFWVVSAAGADFATSSTNIAFPDFTMSGNTLSWSIPNIAQFQLAYGVY